MNVKNLKEQIDFYDKRWSDFRHRPYSSHEKDRLNIILHCINHIKFNSPPEIFDIGCGRGLLSNELSIFGDVTAIDLSPKTIEENRKYYKQINFITGDIFEISLSNKQFDLVVASEVIEHVEEQSRLISIIYRFLKKEGYLILTTPNKKTADRLGIKGDQLIENFLTVSDLLKLLRNKLKVKKIYTAHFECQNKTFWKYLSKISHNRITAQHLFRYTKRGLYTVILAKKIY